MRLALIVTTYERPDALARVLETVARQSVAPDELLVADDGSGPATGEVVAGFKSGAAFPVRHVWLPHDGYRVGRMRNRAIAASDADFIVIVDGDMLLHPDFIADHRRAARPGRYLQGCRIPLDEQATAHALASGETPRWTSRGLGVRRRLYALHSPAASRWCGGIANGLLSIKGCNQGFWRSDLLAANGFDESLAGWGSEDKECCARLENAGLRRRSILFGAVAFHLHHPAADRSAHARNTAAVAATRTSGRTRCDHGIVSPPGAARPQA
ncbi:MAG TPA: glycosyltransferase family 2 protein [Steroidobacteraceae bacterium]|nr:glycosyltransferase family 2 protein [Steroidobacteraceae bacterium]